LIAFRLSCGLIKKGPIGKKYYQQALLGGLTIIFQRFLLYHISQLNARKKFIFLWHTALYKLTRVGNNFRRNISFVYAFCLRSAGIFRRPFGLMARSFGGIHQALVSGSVPPLSRHKT